MTYGTTPGYRPLQTDGLNPMQILRRVASRKWLLLCVAAAVFGTLAFVISRLEPLYTASAEIVIEAPPALPTNPLQPTVALSADREKVMSEVQVLMSRGLAQKAVREFKLNTKPEFNASLDGSLGGKIRRFMGERGTQTEVVQRFMSRLNVYQIGTSRVIAVEFTSADPVLARDIANRVADLYIEDQRQARVDLNARASGWLSEQIDALRQRVADSEAKAEEYRAHTGLLEGNGVQLQSQQLTELNTQLSAARAARSEADARAASLTRLNGTDIADGEESELQVLQSPLIQQLRQQEVQLKRDITDMSADLLPTHPRMIQKQAELEDLQAQIHAEIGKVIASVKNEAQVAASREASVQRQLRELEARRIIADRDQIELRALEREAAANRSVLESFMSRYTEISTRGDISIQETNARVISRAETPEGPSFPQRGPMFVLAAMVAFALGLGVVFVAELTRRTIRFRNDIEGAAGARVLAALPDVAEPQKEALRREGGAFVDGLRSLHAALGIVPAGGNRRGRILAITSTARGEGRTTTAISFARSMAQAGLRVLLIDADFGHPQLESKLGRKLPWGFRDLLAGRAGYSHVISRDPASPLNVMPAGHAYQTSVLVSPKLLPVLGGLVHAYDVVVIDCEPASSGDAQYLMRLADQCLYAVRWNSTDRDRVVENVRNIQAARRRGGLGFVMTGAELSQVA
jgi:polysaccharide biosynthesis transport protein